MDYFNIYFILCSEVKVKVAKNTKSKVQIAKNDLSRTLKYFSTTGAKYTTAIKEAKQQYRDKVESQFNSSDTKRVCQGLHTITD